VAKAPLIALLKLSSVAENRVNINYVSFSVGYNKALRWQMMEVDKL